MGLRKIAISLSLLLLIVGCESRVESDKNSTVTVEENRTEVSDRGIENNRSQKEEGLKFTIETIDSKILHIEEIENGMLFDEFKDRAVMLIFFGYRCPPCLREIPRLNNLISKHKDQRLSF